MIDRSILKTRILKYSSFLKSDKFKVFINDARWKKVLTEGKILFLSTGESVAVDFHNIDFTGPEINNQEWRAQLNRFLWLGTCLEEDLKNEDNYFSIIAVDTIDSFLIFREGMDIPDKEFLWKNLGDNTLSTSIRLGRRYGNGWWGTLPFLNENIASDAFLEKIFESTVKQVEFMIKNMTSCGNWRISQLVSLLFLGYIFQNENWMGIGERGLNEAFHSQVSDDGCHEERTRGYHLWMTKEFSSLFYLSRGLPEINLKINPNKLIKMWEYFIASTCPDGQSTGLNDDNRWGYLNKEKNLQLLDSAVNSRKSFIEGFTDEIAVDMRKESRYFESAGQWFLKADSQVLIFDATKYGGGHCHMASNSVNFFYGNKMLLLDPGSFNYERSDPFCAYGRQTQSHNTLCIDDLSQLKTSAKEYFSDISGKCVFVHNTYSGGYTDGKKSVAGSHERLVIWYKGKICIINDSVIGNGSYFRTNFNFLPGKHSFDGKSLSTNFDDYNIYVKPIYSNVELKLDKYEGSMEPMAGWLAKDGSKLGSGEKGLSMIAKGILSHERGSVAAYAMIPFKGEEKPDASMQNFEELIVNENEDIKVRRYNNPICYSIKSNESVYEIVSAYLKYRDSRLHPSIGRTGKYDSDGKLAFVEFVRNKPVFAYLYDGTYLNYDGMTLIKETEFGNYEKTF